MRLSSVLVTIGTVISSIATAGISKELFKAGVGAVLGNGLMWAFIVGIGIILFGGYVRRGELKQEVERLEELGILDPVKVLKDLTDKLESILERRDKIQEAGYTEVYNEMGWDDIRAELDEIIMEKIMPLMERRELLREKFGAELYGRFAVEFAYAERYLNRAWSAITDGYYHEARACIEQALGGFRKALQIISDGE